MYSTNAYFEPFLVLDTVQVSASVCGVPVCVELFSAYQGEPSLEAGGFGLF